MPQEPRKLDPTLSARDGFGAALRHWRMFRGLSQAELAGVLPVSSDQIAKYEKAERWPSEQAAKRLDAHLQANGELAGLWADGEAERLAVRSSRAPADAEYVGHWTQLLSVLAAAGNAVGGRGLIDIVTTEVRVISRYAASATGRVAEGYLVTKARWLEFGSWVADNQGERARATVWLKRANELATQVDDPVLGAYVLMRRAQRAYEDGQPRRSLDLLEQVAPARLPPRIGALLATRAAQAHAGLGDGPVARQWIKQALHHVGRDMTSDVHDMELASHGTAQYVLAHEGMCLLTLGKPNDAASVLEEVLAGWPATQRLDEGLFRAHLALAQAMTGANDEAVDEAKLALTLGRETGSRRTLRVVRQVMDRGLDGVAGYVDLVDQWTADGGKGGS